MSIHILLDEVIDTFTKMLRENPYERGLNNDQVNERIQHKKILRKALRTCVYGDKQAKMYVKDMIKDILIKQCKINEENIFDYIPFHNSNLLSAEDKFQILLFVYEKQYNIFALERFITEYNLDMPKEDKEGNYYYEITEEEITDVYDRYGGLILSFHDQLTLLSQKIYERYKGNGVIDSIRDMKIDGISAGVSGIPEGFGLDNFFNTKTLPASYDSIWIFYKGKSIHLSFMGFHSYKELIRVCRNIYRYDNPEQLTEQKGYLVAEAKDGARIAVARPPFCESWVFFIRKFDMVLQEDITNLITDLNYNLPIEVIKWLIKGCQVIAITGEQGSGKTTLLMSFIRFIHPSYNLRIQELSFELHLRKIYPRRNIVTFRETDTISGRESLDFQKKSDGTVSILGEVTTNEVCCWLISMSQVASLFTLFTHHAKTTDNLVIAMRNALLMEGGFQNETIAEEQVVEAINFDIHMKKTKEGHRYIERITEIVPIKEEYQKVYHTQKNGSKKSFCTRDIIRFEENQYVWVQDISKEGYKRMKEHWNKEEVEEYQQTSRKWRNYEWCKR
ncbi:Flp pilus assembly complex ATPase component TadA [Velocimicrobium porci]|uniref:Pilus assembly protein CpaF n=1 Tax=Velocimicrobium porci TaxID=2606634 RepID=A0A6L5XZU3_9FIRM|nr:Flp pilus assembly complex ATPase component TadA [Velocimicrobium porci]MSS64252.1 pilus assembly protein CpaF [Velocimicrobium porci]